MLPSAAAGAAHSTACGRLPHSSRGMGVVAVAPSAIFVSACIQHTRFYCVITHRPACPVFQCRHRRGCTMSVLKSGNKLRRGSVPSVHTAHLSCATPAQLCERPRQTTAGGPGALCLERLAQAVLRSLLPCPADSSGVTALFSHAARLVQVPTQPLVRRWTQILLTLCGLQAPLSSSFAQAPATSGYLEPRMPGLARDGCE